MALGMVPSTISAQNNLAVVNLVESMELYEEIEVPHYVVAYYRAEINFEQMRFVPDAVVIRLPDGSTTTVYQQHFIARAGYEYNDPPLPWVTVTPGAGIQDMRYFWSGRDDSGGEQATISVNGTHIISAIWSNGKKFMIHFNGHQDVTLIYELRPVSIRPGPSVPVRVKVLSPFTLIMLWLMMSLLSARLINKFKYI